MLYEFQLQQGSYGKKPSTLQPIGKVAILMDTFHIDHLGPFVRSEAENAYLIVCIDAYTKYVFMKEGRNTKDVAVLNFSQKSLKRSEL